MADQRTFDAGVRPDAFVAFEQNGVVDPDVDDFVVECAAFPGWVYGVV
nr:hypothetical protein [Rhodococcus sp. P1Y]